MAERIPPAIPRTVSDWERRGVYGVTVTGAVAVADT
jgi:hypothetical protein